MVAMSEDFSRRWEAERERREIAELEDLEKLLTELLGGDRSVSAEVEGTHRASASDG